MVKIIKFDDVQSFETIPKDWSLKTQVDIQLVSDDSEKGELLLQDYQALASLLKFYVFIPN